MRLVVRKMSDGPEIAELDTGGDSMRVVGAEAAEGPAVVLGVPKAAVGIDVRVGRGVGVGPGRGRGVGRVVTQEI